MGAWSGSDTMRRAFAAVSINAVLALACGATPPPPKPPPTREDRLEPIARACARAAACADAHDPNHLRNATSCVDWWLVNTRVEQAEIACMLRATTCQEIERCTHDPSDLGAETFCEAHPGALGVCDGTRLYSCSDDASESTAVDCAALGGVCVEQRAAGGLVVRGCTSPRLCPKGAPARRCEGERTIVRCEDGLAERRDCPAGTKCVVTGESGELEATCEGARSEDRISRCAKPGFAACEGDRATFCTLVGRDAWLRVTDCRAQGMTCAMRAGRANCVFENATCAATARCDGDTLVFCAAGSEMRVPCKSLGFSRCDPSARGAEAACR